MNFTSISISSVMGSETRLYITVMTSSGKETVFSPCLCPVGQPFIICF